MDPDPPRADGRSLAILLGLLALLLAAIALAVSDVWATWFQVR